MNNYSEVTATSALVELELNTGGRATIAGIAKQGATIAHWVSLHHPFIIAADNTIKSLSVDNIDITDYITDNQINIDRPFYQWLHLATKQGWLLEP
jgi:hypothetical protein